VSLKIEVPAKRPKVSAYKYAWVRDTNVDSYKLHISPLLLQLIWAEDNAWYMRTAFYDAAGKETVFSGYRPTLEAAFKASDRLLYKNFPKEWTVTDARAIMASWSGEISE
jgi:hypothetical protein